MKKLIYKSFIEEKLCLSSISESQKDADSQRLILFRQSVYMNNHKKKINQQMQKLEMDKIQDQNPVPQYNYNNYQHVIKIKEAQALAQKIKTFIKR